MCNYNNFENPKKDPTNKNDKNNIIYKINCKKCYIGETKRKLKTRINEHKRNVNQGTIKGGLTQQFQLTT